MVVKYIEIVILPPIYLRTNTEVVGEYKVLINDRQKLFSNFFRWVCFGVKKNRLHREISFHSKRVFKYIFSSGNWSVYLHAKWFSLRIDGRLCTLCYMHSSLWIGKSSEEQLKNPKLWKSQENSLIDLFWNFSLKIVFKEKS